MKLKLETSSSAPAERDPGHFCLRSGTVSVVERLGVPAASSTRRIFGELVRRDWDEHDDESEEESASVPRQLAEISAAPAVDEACV